VPARSPWPRAPATSGRGTGRLTASSSGGTVRLRLRNAPGSARIRVLTGRAPGSVTVNGRPLPHAAGPDALRGMAEGWAFTSGPFGGVVLKTAPGGGAADLTLTGL
jgi:hypothetical protein